MKNLRTLYPIVRYGEIQEVLFTLYYNVDTPRGYAVPGKKNHLVSIVYIDIIFVKYYIYQFFMILL